MNNVTLLELKLYIIFMFWSFAKAIMTYLFSFCAEMDDPETACGEDCLNKLLLIEWYEQITSFVYFKVVYKKCKIIGQKAFELCVCVL